MCFKNVFYDLVTLYSLECLDVMQCDLWPWILHRNNEIWKWNATKYMQKTHLQKLYHIILMAGKKSQPKAIDRYNVIKRCCDEKKVILLIEQALEYTTHSHSQTNRCGNYFSLISLSFILAPFFSCHLLENPKKDIKILNWEERGSRRRRRRGWGRRENVGEERRRRKREGQGMREMCHLKASYLDLN